MSGKTTFIRTIALNSLLAQSLNISECKAILSYLNKPQHFVLVSTHDVGLTDMLEIANFELYHFTEKAEDDTLFFDYKLKKREAENPKCHTDFRTVWLS